MCYVSVIESDTMLADATKAALKKAKTLGIGGPFLPLDLKDLTEPITDEEYNSIPSPATGVAGHLTRPRDFNLMFQTSVGAMSDASAIAYLRPETAQVRFFSPAILITNNCIIFERESLQILQLFSGRLE